MVNHTVATSSCFIRPFPANPTFLFPSASSANNSVRKIHNWKQPNYKKRQVITFHSYYYFNSCLRPSCARSFGFTRSSSGFCCSFSRTSGEQAQVVMGFTDLTAPDRLTQVDSSAARKIPRLNATVLGESLASEDDQLILPSDQFSSRAHVSSHQKVHFSSLIWLLCLFAIHFSPHQVYFLCFLDQLVSNLCLSISIWRCTKGPLRILLDFGPTLRLPSSSGNTDGTSWSTLRTLMSEKAKSR